MACAIGARWDAVEARRTGNRFANPLARDSCRSATDGPETTYSAADADVASSESIAVDQSGPSHNGGDVIFHSLRRTPR